MTQGTTTDKNERASVGWLKSTGFEGDIDTTSVDYRQGNAGIRSITLYGLQPTETGSFIGIQIDFAPNTPLGPIEVPQEWPRTVIVGYFRQTSSGQRTTFQAKNGELDLQSYDQAEGFATGTFNVTADVEGTDRTFEGSFDIRYAD